MAELKAKEDLPEEILTALEELEKLSLDPNMRMEALNKEMWIRDQILLINMAKNAETDGFAKGVESTAKNLKKLGVNNQIIVDATGLDLKTIEKL